MKKITYITHNPYQATGLRGWEKAFIMGIHGEEIEIEMKYVPYPSLPIRIYQCLTKLITGHSKNIKH